MKLKNTNKSDRYPFIRAQRFDCGDGWFSILDQFMDKVDKIRFQDELANFEVIAVKEKFGDLRIYIRNGNDRISSATNEAMQAARTMCEDCGGPSFGVRNHGGWLSNICDQCLERRKRQRDA